MPRGLLGPGQEAGEVVDVVPGGADDAEVEAGAIGRGVVPCQHLGVGAAGAEFAQEGLLVGVGLGRFEAGG